MIKIDDLRGLSIREYRLYSGSYPADIPPLQRCNLVSVYEDAEVQMIPESQTCHIGYADLKSARWAYRLMRPYPWSIITVFP